MAKKKLPLTSFEGALEKQHIVGTMKTGFSWVELPVGHVQKDNSIPHYYVLFLLRGECRLKCYLFDDELLSEHQMVLIPKGSHLRLEALADVELLVLAFDTTFIQSDPKLLEYCCNYGAQNGYSYYPLPIKEIMLDEVRLIIRNLKADKIRDTKFYGNKNYELFILLQSYYKLSDIAPFIFPIVSGTSDLKSFVLNNYLEVNGNVRALQMLSGIPMHTFKKRFQEQFGMSAKQWLSEREAELIREVASREGMTATGMLQDVHVADYTELLRLCRRYFDCTPGELVESLRSHTV